MFGLRNALAPAICACAWLFVTSASGQSGQAAPALQEAPEAAPAAPPADPVAPTVEAESERERRRLWDIVKILPIVFYTPETSLGLGAGLLFQFDLPGAKAARRPSSITLGGVYTLEEQVLAQLGPELRFGHDDYVLKLDLTGARFPNRFYGTGNIIDSDVYDTYTDCYMRAEVDGRMRPFAEGSALRPLFLGLHAGGAWSSVRHVEGEVLEGMNDPGENEVMVAGLGPSVSWDSRDSISWPTRGAFVDAKFTLFEEAFGGDVRYRRLALDLRRYQPTFWNHILALRLVSQSVWGEVPFQRLPQLGGASLFRGWYGGQLRDRMLLAAEAEYRVPLGKRLAVVAFGSVGRVASRIRNFDVRQLHAAGGGGVRLSVDKRDRLNIRLDLAYGDSFSPYLQFREAF
jgi:hypothetical protein